MTTSTTPNDQPLWQPAPDVYARAQIGAFMREAAKRHGIKTKNYDELHRWSVENRADFWSLVWDFCKVKASIKGTEILRNPNQMPGSVWFPQARLNYAENLLRVAEEGVRDREAIIFWAEDQIKRRMNFGELYDQVSVLVQHLRAQGVKPGDRVVALVANTPEAIIAMLATSAVGAVFSSCSPDFGTPLILDRFGQIEPKIFFASDGQYYKGKAVDLAAKIREIEAALPTVQETILLPFTQENPPIEGLRKATRLNDILRTGKPGQIAFEQLPFDHPLFILYSSGTTGLPKCFIHGQGGVLLQHLKEYRLQCDIKEGDRVFYHTTCGWMMWNWLVSALAVGASLALYDGNPLMRDGNILFDFAQEEKFTLFGTSAPFVQSIKNINLAPKKTHDLSSVKILTSTGAPLLHEHFDYLYANVLGNVPVSSISGGSDIVSLFVCGNPISPVWRGEIPGAGLGMDMAVFDAEGQEVTHGGGELVCRKSFPVMPIGFWSDPDQKKYRKAYFEKWPGVWCHGDWTERTLHGGFIIHGRSDSTTNRQGIRIGTAEFYSLVERLPEIENSLIVSQRIPGDERIILFVKPREGVTFTEELKKKIAKHMKEQGSPRHVPDEIHAAPGIPMTRNSKKAELAVENIIHGKPVTNVASLANPEVLGFYEELAKTLANQTRT
ncbi:MAG: acetoacetate--CoA ligase [Alphaproteobacteria bacterium]|nr:acetoacetate--CoA ligase [Alphaproteobacteria bacterium]